MISKLASLVVPAWARYGAPALAAALLATWVTSTVYGARITQLKLDHAAVALEASNASREALARVTAQRDSYASRAARLDAEGFASLKEKDDEIIRLRNRPASAVRLYVAADCPKPVGVPEVPGSARVGNDARPELNAVARQDYFNLRAGLARQYEQLNVCQKLLKGITQ